MGVTLATKDARLATLRARQPFNITPCPYPTCSYTTNISVSAGAEFDRLTAEAVGTNIWEHFKAEHFSPGQ